MFIPKFSEEVRDTFDAIVDVNVSVHCNGVKCDDASVWGKDQLVDFLLQRERVLEIEWLAGNNGLESIVKPFTEGMDKACAIGANGASA